MRDRPLILLVFPPTYLQWEAYLPSTLYSRRSCLSIRGGLHPSVWIAQESVGLALACPTLCGSRETHVPLRI